LPFRVFEAEAKSILSKVSGFLAEAGFTHSLTPARNCTFGCSYCYVPTMRVQGGLKPEDWRQWGQHTTFKSNAAVLVEKSLRADQVIYCSPLTDPYQPAENESGLMREILEVLKNAKVPPKAFVIQTRGPGILRDLELIAAVAERTRISVSFSVTTDREEVRRVFEPHCAAIEERWATVRRIRDAGLRVSAALAPLLPCDPAELVRRAIRETNGPVVVDPFHVREVKRSGATTREAAIAICRRHGWEEWLDPAFQRKTVEGMAAIARDASREFGQGAAGFGLLVK
jgi:DNA repair photolyase